MTRILNLIIIIILLSPAYTMAEDNEKCYMCHNPFLKKTLPDGKEVPLFVDKEAFCKSVHKNISCTQCHKDVKLDPMMHQPAKYDPYKACISCHNKDNIKHSQAHTEKGISCNECHHFAGASSHQFERGEKSSNICISCHNLNIQRVDVHKKLPCLTCHQGAYKDMKAPNCNKCHTDVNMYQHKQIECVACHSQDKVCTNEKNEIIVGTFSHNVTSKVDCAKCHSKDNQLGLPKTNPAEEYKGSIHGMALQKGIKDVPDCDYCHGKMHEMSKPKDVLEFCTQCHNDEKKMAKYGLSTYPVTSYKESFHGIAHKYGQKGMPVCTDCHNTHDIRAKDDLKASINKANISKVCARCHKNNHPNFAVNPVHLKPVPKGRLDSMIVFWVNAGYMWLLIPAVIGGMLIHVSLNLFRTLRSRKKEKHK